MDLGAASRRPCRGVGSVWAANASARHACPRLSRERKENLCSYILFRRFRYNAASRHVFVSVGPAQRGKARLQVHEVRHGGLQGSASQSEAGFKWSSTLATKRHRECRRSKEMPGIMEEGDGRGGAMAQWQYGPRRQHRLRCPRRPRPGPKVIGSECPATSATAGGVRRQRG